MISQNENGSYSVTYTVRDSEGKAKRITQSGFLSIREARNFYLEVAPFESAAEEEMRSQSSHFETLVDEFLEEKEARLRASTVMGYRMLIKRFIMPAFEGRPINEITAAEVRAWQNRLMTMDYSPVYLRRIDTLLVSVFNYGISFYGLTANPSVQAGSLGKWRTDDFDFWTLDEYRRFYAELKTPERRLAFDLLYWGGLRKGELLALTKEDFLMDESAVAVNKSLRRYHRCDIITPPKTEKGKRKVYLHSSLMDDIKSFFAHHPELKASDRVFSFTSELLKYEMKRASAAAGVKRIKIHELRHSHASLLINLNVTPLIIAERLGHEKIETTLSIYSHLYPGKQREIVAELENIAKG